MSALVQTVLAVRRTARASYTLAFVLLVAGLELLGLFHTRPDALRIEHGVLGALWAILFALRGRRRARVRDDTDERLILDVELGALLAVAVYAIVATGGGLGGPFYPLVYALVAFVAAFARRPGGAILVLGIVSFEAALWFVTEQHDDAGPFALHAAFIVFFGILNLLLTKAELARVRQASRRELDEERERVKDDARLFRLVAAPTASGTHDDERLLRSSIAEVHHALYHTLELAKHAMDLHTIAVFFVNDAGTELSLREMATDSDDIVEEPLSTRDGVVGAVAARGIAMNLENLKPGYRGIAYYRSGAKVRAFLGLPLRDGARVVAVLCGDRTLDRAFGPSDEAALAAVGRHVLRIVENERVFVQLERSKREQHVLHRASAALGAAVSEDQVIDAGLGAAREIAAYDFAAITTYDGAKKAHAVKRAVGDGAEKVVALTFKDNTSLTAMAVKNRHYLPYRGDFDPAQQILFTKRAALPDMRSLLVLPLVVREDAIGALVLAAHRPEVFSDGVRATLQVLANQLAVSLSNAAAVRRLEEMATTDGLTGCLNKRAFLEELDRRLRAAQRFGRRLSLLVTDIDHFKNVNDTYGHATGDVVIKELGAILRRVKRDTDIVARFGGEEFCVLCEETDTKGAVLLAERARTELAETVFQTELGKLKVTCSVGVATLPTDAATSGELFETADKALYAAKRLGRNRVCTSVDIGLAPAAAAAPIGTAVARA